MGRTVTFNSAVVDVITILDEKYIRLEKITPAGDRKVALMDFDEELFAVISGTYWYVVNSGRLYTGYKHKGKKEHLSLPLVVIACQVYGATRENWKEKATMLQQVFRNEKIAVDHKNSARNSLGWYDNRLRNLQTVPQTLNAAKGNCTRVMPHGCFYIPTADGGIYGKYNTENGATEVCDLGTALTPEKVAQLRHFCKTGEFAERVKYETYPAGSEETLAIMKADLQEKRLYLEAAKL